MCCCLGFWKLTIFWTWILMIIYRGCTLTDNTMHGLFLLCFQISAFPDIQTGTFSGNHLIDTLHLMFAFIDGNSPSCKGYFHSHSLKSFSFFLDYFSTDFSERYFSVNITNEL